jgi:hypothetical protein
MKIFKKEISLVQTRAGPKPYKSAHLFSLYSPPLAQPTLTFQPAQPHYPFPSAWTASQLLRPDFLLRSRGLVRRFLIACSGPPCPSSSSRRPLNRSRLPPGHQAEAPTLGRNPSPIQILTERIEPRRESSWR